MAKDIATLSARIQAFFTSHADADRLLSIVRMAAGCIGKGAQNALTFPSLDQTRRNQANNLVKASETLERQYAAKEEIKIAYNDLVTQFCTDVIAVAVKHLQDGPQKNSTAKKILINLGFLKACDSKYLSNIANGLKTALQDDTCEFATAFNLPPDLFPKPQQPRSSLAIKALISEEGERREYQPLVNPTADS